MAKAPPPNYTQSPNVYFDKWLREINSLAELKVVNAIMRNTFGWHEKETTLTFSDLQDITGLSRGGLTKGIQLALEHGYIERTDGSRGRVCTYKIAIQTEQQHDSETSLQNRLVEKKTSLRRRPQLVHKIDRQLVYGVDRPIDKEKEKENLKKEGEGPLTIFNFWKSEMSLPDAQFTDDREQAISERLQDSTVEEIEAAIRGCKVSDFHMGREPGKPQKLNGIEFICQKRSRLESFIAMAPSDKARSKPPPTETAAQRLIRENCPRCFGTTTEVIPGKGGRDCDHKPRTADAGSTGNGSAPQDSEQCVSERSDRRLRAVQ